MNNELTGLNEDQQKLLDKIVYEVRHAQTELSILASGVEDESLVEAYKLLIKAQRLLRDVQTGASFLFK